MIHSIQTLVSNSCGTYQIWAETRGPPRRRCYQGHNDPPFPSSSAVGETSIPEGSMMFHGVGSWRASTAATWPRGQPWCHTSRYGTSCRACQAERRGAKAWFANLDLLSPVSMSVLNSCDDEHDGWTCLCYDVLDEKTCWSQVVVQLHLLDVHLSTTMHLLAVPATMLLLEALLQATIFFLRYWNACDNVLMLLNVKIFEVSVTKA